MLACLRTVCQCAYVVIYEILCAGLLYVMPWLRVWACLWNCLVICMIVCERMECVFVAMYVSQHVSVCKCQYDIRWARLPWDILCPPVNSNLMLMCKKYNMHLFACESVYMWVCHLSSCSPAWYTLLELSKNVYLLICVYEVKLRVDGNKHAWRRRMPSDDTDVDGGSLGCRSVKERPEWWIAEW